MTAEAVRTVQVLISGRVQGVWYRAWTEENALGLGLVGWVRNRRDGAVEALFSGPPDAVAAMLLRCADGPSKAQVTAVEIVAEGLPAPDGFLILPTA